MKPNPRQRLHDIIEAIEKIEGFIKDADFNLYHTDPMLHDAIERNVEIISEASRHIPDDMKDRFKDIPWRQIADIGNALRHGYDVIDDKAMWNTVNNDLAPLKEAVIAMIEEVGKRP
ncbi:MAG TPA: DUF86 domain-containing protein [Rhodospirillales bacterium]|nr:DUF86 domain-containing protein [Rhodospirillales bacterium]